MALMDEREYFFWTDDITKFNTGPIIEQYELVRHYIPYNIICKLAIVPLKYRQLIMMKYPEIPKYEIKLNRRTGVYELTQSDDIKYVETRYYIHKLLERIRLRYDDENNNEAFSFSDFYNVNVEVIPVYFNDKTGEEYFEHELDDEYYENQHGTHLDPNTQVKHAKDIIEKELDEFYESHPKIKEGISYLRNLLLNRELYLMKILEKDFLVPELYNKLACRYKSHYTTTHYQVFIENRKFTTQRIFEKILDLVKFFNVEKKITLNNITDKSFICSFSGSSEETLNVEITSCMFYESENPEYLCTTDDFKYDYNFHDVEFNVYNLSTLKNSYQRDLYSVCVLYINMMRWIAFNEYKESIKWYNLSDEPYSYTFYHRWNNRFLQALYLLETNQADDSLNIGNFHELPDIDMEKFGKFLEEKDMNERLKRQRLEPSGIHLKEFQDPDIYSSDSDMPIDSDSD